MNPKRKYRKELANLPFEEKVKIVVRLQEIANEINRSMGRLDKIKRVWEL